MATERTEDYLKMLDSIIKKKGYARVKDVSEIMGLNPSSVTGMFKKLNREGYINYEKYGAVTLTPEGDEIARATEEKYDVLNISGISIIPGNTLNALLQHRMAVLCMGKRRPANERDGVAISSINVQKFLAHTLFAFCNINNDALIMGDHTLLVAPDKGLFFDPPHIPWFCQYPVLFDKFPAPFLTGLFELGLNIRQVSGMHKVSVHDGF
jgi:DNA-binding MarR family transcriptional regulator